MLIIIAARIKYKPITILNLNAIPIKSLKANAIVDKNWIIIYLLEIVNSDAWQRLILINASIKIATTKKGGPKIQIVPKISPAIEKSLPFDRKMLKIAVIINEAKIQVSIMQYIILALMLKYLS
jgi:hypothetical protein